MKANNRLRTNGAASGRVRFVIDPATRKAVFTQGNQVTTVDLPGSRKTGAAPTDSRLSVAAPSESEARLARLAEGYDVPEILPFQAFGETWFLKRLDFEGLALVGLLQPRDKKNRMSLSKRGNLTGLQAAMLFVVCVKSETEDVPYFATWEAAWRQAAHRAPKIVETNDLLFQAILSLNPEILPANSTETEELEIPEDDADLATAAAN